MITTTAPTTVVAHRLVGARNSLTNAVTGTAFDGETYSRMKFGDARALRNLGADLGEADGVRDSLPEGEVVGLERALHPDFYHPGRPCRAGGVA